MILAIDTSTRLLSIALVEGQTVVGEYSWRSSNQHNTQLAAMIGYLLATADYSAAQLQGVAVANGPGSFTGVRVGMAAAKGVALAHRLPFYAVSTLDVVAHTLPLQFVNSIQIIYALLPAGRGRLIAAHYQTCDQELPYCMIGGPQLMTWVELVAHLAHIHSNQPVWLVGELDEILRLNEASLPDHVQLIPPTFRLHRAATLGMIATGFAPQDPITATPFYIKEP